MLKSVIQREKQWKNGVKKRKSRLQYPIIHGPAGKAFQISVLV